MGSVLVKTSLSLSSSLHLLLTMIFFPRLTFLLLGITCLTCLWLPTTQASDVKPLKDCAMIECIGDTRLEEVPCLKEEKKCFKLQYISLFGYHLRGRGEVQFLH